MIPRILKVVQRLRGRSSHELFTRVSQAAYAWGERVSLRLGTNSVPEVANVSQAFTRPFFEGISKKAHTAAALRSLAPNDEFEVLQRATRIESGSIPLLGYGDVHVGTSPDWQHEPFAGLTAPLRHWKTIPYLDPAIVGDHKVVWEISRHQYFVTLGQAWQYTGDERWPRAFAKYLNAWLDTNPAGVGINWTSSLEVSYRAISWIWAMHQLGDSELVDVMLKRRVLQSLQAHGRHLERYLSTYFSPNTHLTGEALGLYYIGTQCPELPNAARWKELGARTLEQALAFQVLPDGVYFEQATQYHRYTIEIYLHYLLLARQAGTEPAAIVEQSLQKMFDVLLHLSRADGTIPLLGDDDGGRLVQLDDRLPHDVRALLAMGAVTLRRSDLAWAGRGDDAALCWMLGASAVGVRDALVAQPPSENARAFTDGGLYIMRDGWNLDDGHAAIDAGPHGALSCGHSHADALSIELSLGGRPLFVDSGTYTYVGAERNAFRTTAAHNTVEIDGTSASLPDTAFRWVTTAGAHATEWVIDPEFCYFSGTHGGYAALPTPAQHERSVFHAAPGLWTVLDKIQSAGSHNVVLRWHCAPGLSATPRDGSPGFSLLQIVDESGHPRAALAVFGGERGAMRIDRDWVSPQFARKAEAEVLAWSERCTGNATLGSIVIDTARWTVVPPPPGAQTIAGVLGCVWVRSTDRFTSELRLIVIGDGSSPILFQGFAVTGDIVCFQVDSITGIPLGMAAVGASCVSKDGEMLLPRSTHRRWVQVARGDDATAAGWRTRIGDTRVPREPSAATRLSSSPVPSHA